MRNDFSFLLSKMFIIPFPEFSFVSPNYTKNEKNGGFSSFYYLN